MGPLLVLVGLAGLVIGVISLVRPIQRLRIRTRRQAGIVAGVSLLVVLIGGALTPTGDDAIGDETAATATAVETQTTILQAATTSTAAATTTTTRPVTTTIQPAITTTTEATTTTTTVPVQGTPVEVTEVIDGDTIEVRFNDGTVDTVRLIGINTPEQGECYATEATTALNGLIAGRTVGLTSDSTDRDVFDRLLRYLWVDDAMVNEQLVVDGYAIARRYPPDTAHADDLEAAQAAAVDREVGMWAPDACGPAATAQVEVADVIWDPPGSDIDNLDQEVVVIANTGVAPVDFTGWVVKDESASHRYQFPSGFTLLAGETATIHTGCGTDETIEADTDLFWCFTGSAIWNNDGDTAFLLDPSGNIVATYPYHDQITVVEVATTAAGDSGDCDPAYPTVCIPRYPPDLNCGDIRHRRFEVRSPDPHGFDRDNDGVGCESR